MHSMRYFTSGSERETESSCCQNRKKRKRKESESIAFDLTNSFFPRVFSAPFLFSVYLLLLLATEEDPLFLFYSIAAFQCAHTEGWKNKGNGNQKCENIQRSGYGILILRLDPVYHFLSLLSPPPLHTTFSSCAVHNHHYFPYLFFTIRCISLSFSLLHPSSSPYL